MIASFGIYVTQRSLLTTLFLAMPPSSTDPELDAPPPSDWGPSPALLAGSGGLDPPTPPAGPSSIIRGKSFIGFLDEDAVKLVCGVATPDSNINKKIDKV